MSNEIHCIMCAWIVSLDGDQISFLMDMNLSETFAFQASFMGGVLGPSCQFIAGQNVLVEFI